MGKSMAGYKMVLVGIDELVSKDIQTNHLVSPFLKFFDINQYETNKKHVVSSDCNHFPFN